MCSHEKSCSSVFLSFNHTDLLCRSSKAVQWLKTYHSQSKLGAIFPCFKQPDLCDDAQIYDLMPFGDFIFNIGQVSLPSISGAQAQQISLFMRTVDL